MNDRVYEKLERTYADLCLPSENNVSDIQKVFEFRPASDLDITETAELSKYTMMLGQYLVTLVARYNTARVMSNQYRKVLDRAVANALRTGKIAGKTLKEREANAIAESPELQKLESDFDEYNAEKELLEGLEKPIIELINVFKAEVKRRENERQTAVRERY